MHGAGAAPPTVGRRGALDAAAAQRVLSGAFGSLHTITAGRLRVEPDQRAILAAYDRVSIANHVVNPTTGRPWAAGDAARTYPSGLDGFQDPASSDVYINATTAGPVTSCHETLHFNTARDWRGFVGDRINEGVTEVLAQHAVRHARLRITDSPAYVDEQRVARALIDVAGQDVVERAYFNGGADSTAMQAAVDAARGSGTWAAVRTAAEAHRWTRAVRLLQGSAPRHHRRAAPAHAAGAGSGHHGSGHH